MTCLQPHSRLQAPNSKRKGGRRAQPSPASSQGCCPGLCQENLERSGSCPLTFYSASREVGSWRGREGEKPQLVPKTESPLGHMPWSEASLGSRRP